MPTKPRSQPVPKDSDWLLPFLPALSECGRRVLEIGCGPGIDAARLTAAGFEVTAFDQAPLQRAREVAPDARLLRATLAQAFPFRDGSFDAAVSSLALHYQPWQATRETFAEIRRVLHPGGPVLFRVNATDDVHHGAGEGERLERGFYRTPSPYFSETKRFFDEAMVRDALDGLFEIEQLEHQTIHRYENPKRVWECLARRR